MPRPHIEAPRGSARILEHTSAATTGAEAPSERYLYYLAACASAARPAAVARTHVRPSWACT